MLLALLLEWVEASQKVHLNNYFPDIALCPIHIDSIRFAWKDGIQLGASKRLGSWIKKYIIALYSLEVEGYSHICELKGCFFLSRPYFLMSKSMTDPNKAHLTHHFAFSHARLPQNTAQTYLHISVWWTVGRRWKTWLLTARLCSSRKGSNTTPSLTGNVRRSSSLWLAGIEEGEKVWTFPLASAVQ